MFYRLELVKEFRISGWMIQPGAKLMCGSGNVANTLIQKGIAKSDDDAKRSDTLDAPKKKRPASKAGKPGASKADAEA